jgi:hypothetical protein
MVERVLATPGLYFSYTYDLTRSLQQQLVSSSTSPNAQHTPLHRLVDTRFHWNRFLQDHFDQHESVRFQLCEYSVFDTLSLRGVQLLKFTLVRS